MIAGSRNPQRYTTRWLQIMLVVACMVALAAPPQRAQAAANTIINGPHRYDTDGKQIHAFGSTMVKVGDTYYWIGLDWRTLQFNGYRCYASTDLVTWRFVRTILAPQPSGDLASNRVVEGGDVIFNQSTNKWVMGLHIDNNTYTEAKVGFATSDSVCGNYTYQGNSFKPLGNDSRDMGLFKDSDGSAYLIASAHDSLGGALKIYRLSADYLSVVSEVARLPIKEAPALIKKDGVYFLLASNLTGWSTNPNSYTTATSLAGPWSQWADVAPPATNTYNTQTQSIIAIEGSAQTTYMYLGSRWKGGADARYIWLPMDVNSVNRTMYMPNYYDAWSIDTATGQWSPGGNVGNGNLALGATVTASSSLEGWGWSRNAANDGNRNSSNTMGWTSDGNIGAEYHTEWVQFDLGSSKTVATVELYPRNDPGKVEQGFPVDFSIKLADDAACTNWVVGTSRQGYTIALIERMQSFQVTPRAARCVRIEATRLRANPTENNAYRMQLAEVEIYGNGTTAANNRAFGATVTSSSSVEGWEWGRNLVNDGNPASTSGTKGWSSDSNIGTQNHTEWIQLSFGASTPLSSVKLLPRDEPGKSGQGFPIDFSIQLANDPACTTWTTVVNQQNYAEPTNGVGQRFTFASQSAYCVRVQATKLRAIPSDNNAYRMQLAEIEAS